MNIKPIETRYKGYRFRSRLEARWAVFFDSLGIKYRYEDEGYSYEGELLDDGSYKQYCYLPDFYFPDVGRYAEVKGSDEQLKQDLEKIYWAIEGRATPVEKGLVLLSDIPDPDKCRLDSRFPYILYMPVFNMLYWHKGVEKKLVCPRVTYGFDGFFDIESATDVWDGTEDGVSVNETVWGRYDYLRSTNSPAGVDRWSRATVNMAHVKAALEKARGARFEHGEHGL
jgi:hypothetical protein